VSGRRPRFGGLVRLLAAALLVHACGGDGDGPTEPEPVPGTLRVTLQSPNGDDGGLLFTLTGPGIESLEAPGLELFESGDSARRRVLVAGPVASGTVLRFRVPDVEQRHRYSVTLHEVARRTNYEQRGVQGYQLTVDR
jgi:hypothetical protein